MEESSVLKLAVKQLDEYFSNDRTSFDILLLFTGTDFQRLVFDELRKIPYGVNVSYSELAEHVGRPSAVRAVANANGRNPLSLFVPCHRVIGNNGSLTGYAGGLSAKKFLLDLESKR
jgi:methylated-DNA-[protein]-cysteine S-methyltransferase